MADNDADIHDAGVVAGVPATSASTTPAATLPSLTVPVVPVSTVPASNLGQTAVSAPFGGLFGTLGTVPANATLIAPVTWSAAKQHDYEEIKRSKARAVNPFANPFALLVSNTPFSFGPPLTHGWAPPVASAATHSLLSQSAEAAAISGLGSSSAASSFAGLSGQLQDPVAKQLHALQQRLNNTDQQPAAVLARLNSGAAPAKVRHGKAPSYVPKPEKYNKDKHGLNPKVWFETVYFLTLFGVDLIHNFKWYFDGNDALWLPREVERLTKESRFTYDNLKASFLRLFELEKRNIRHEARAKFHNGQVVMKEGSGLRTYVRDFREVARDAETMSEEDLIHWFIGGLTKDLRKKCGVQPTIGHDLQSTDALIDFAYGQEILSHFENHSRPNNRVAIFVAVAQGSGRNHGKKRKALDANPAQSRSSQPRASRKRYCLTSEQRKLLKKRKLEKKCILCGQPSTAEHNVQTCINLNGAVEYTADEMAAHDKRPQRNGD